MNFKHGHARKGELSAYYRIWRGIKKRCYNENCQDYPKYGGRGIQMYRPWIDDSGAFITWILENLGPKPESMSLDRKDNNGNYEPGNLRWATASEQAQNRRKAVAQTCSVCGEEGHYYTSCGLSAEERANTQYNRYHREQRKWR